MPKNNASRPLSTMHYTLEDTSDRLRVMISSKKNIRTIFTAGWIMLICLAVLLVFLFSSLPIIRSAFRGNGLGLIFLLIPCVGAGVILLWELRGVEAIEITREGIKTRLQVGGWGRTYEYVGEFVQNLRVAPITYATKGLFYVFEQKGLIAFDYGTKTVRFGASLDEAEARMIVDAITQRFHRYQRK